jgi:hypothetical protein
MPDQPPEADFIVTVTHLRTVPAWNSRVGFCAKMARSFFARHGLDWAQFVREGIAASALENTGDALALRVVEHARRDVLAGDNSNG